MAKLRENSTILKSTGEEIIATKEDLENKVDKVEGKQLSTNDYTNAEKQKNQNNADKIDILSGASGIVEKANKEDLDTHKIKNITAHNVSRGISNFAGNNQEVTIPHGLQIKPTSAYAFPTVNPEGFLGEVWIRMDETNLYVGNSGSFTGNMTWTAIG